MIAVLKNKLIYHKFQVFEHILATGAAAMSRLSMLLITLINTQYLPLSEFGTYTVLMLIANMVSAFVSCGGDMWLNRFTRHHHARMAKAPLVSEYYFKISSCLAAFVVSVALGFMLFGQPAFNYQGMAVAFCLLWAACAGLIETLLAIMRTTNDIRRFFIIRDFIMPVSLIFCVVFLKINSALHFYALAFTIWAVTFLSIICLMYNQASLYILNITKTSHQWKPLRKGLLAYTAGLIINNFLTRLANGFDTLILSRICPISMVGKYRFSTHIANGFLVVQHFVFLALPWHLRQPKVALTEVSLTQKEGIQTVYLRQKMLLLTALPALIVLMLSSKYLLGFLGYEFESVAPLFCIFLVFRFSELLWGPQHEILISNNLVKQNTYAYIFAIGMGALSFWVGYELLTLEVIKCAILATGLSSITAQWAQFYILKRHYQTLAIPNIKWIPYLPILITLLALGYGLCQ